MKIFISLFSLAHVPNVIGETNCPTSHQWAYSGGYYCCATNREKDREMCGFTKCGDTCDGSIMGPESQCCEDNSYIKCEDATGGNGDLCKNNEAATTTACTGENCMTFWNNIGFPGLDMAVSVPAQPDQNACMDVCIKTVGCQAMSYRQSDKLCVLKSGTKSDNVNVMEGLVSAWRGTYVGPSFPGTRHGIYTADDFDCLDKGLTCDTNAKCENNAGIFTCKCNDQLEGDGATCGYSAAVTAALSASKCPTDKCWTYDINNGCTLDSSKAGCEYLLTCDYHQMKFAFPKIMFGETRSNTDFNLGLTLTNTDVPTTNAGLQYLAALGTDGQTVAKESDGKISFTKIFSVSKPSGLDIINAQGIDDIIYMTNAGTATLTIKCIYSASASAISDAISVIDPSDVQGAVTVEATLDAGLELKFYTNSAYDVQQTASISIGATVYPMVTWKVNSLVGMVGYYVKSCRVQDGDVEDSGIKIIDGSCYSKTVSAKPIGPKFVSELSIDVVTAKMEYDSFSYDTATIDKQKLICEIEFCVITDSNPDCHVTPILNNAGQCPDTTGYEYSWNGVE